MNIIVAIGKNNEIGCENNLLWPIREDLRRFKSLTIGHPVIMGRNTWLSLPRRPLSGRLNIVVSATPEFDPMRAGTESFSAQSSAGDSEIRQKTTSDIKDGFVMKASSLEEALRIAAEYSAEEPFVIGGGRLYEAALIMADRLFLTRINASAKEADTFFPTIIPNEWEEEETSPVYDWEDPRTSSRISYRFQTLRRIPSRNSSKSNPTKTPSPSI